MTPELIGPMFWLIIKIFTILGIAIYVVFAGVVVRQEQLMSKVLEAGPERALRVIAWLYFIASLFVLFMAIVLL